MILKEPRPDGTVAMRRPAYRPGTYTVPEPKLKGLLGLCGRQTFDQAMNGRLLGGFSELGVTEADGHSFHLLQEYGTEQCVEVEVADGEIVDVLPVPPERAWEIALAQDREESRDVVYESA